MGLVAEELADERLDRGHACLAAHEHDLVDIPGGLAGIVEGLLHGLERAPQEVAHELLELGPAEAEVEVLGTARVGGDEGQVDLRLLDAGELDLGLLRLRLETLEGLAVLAQVDAFGLPELVDEPVDDAVVEVVTAEVGVAVRAEHLEGAVADLEDGDVEGAATEVVDGDNFVGLLVEAVGEGGGGGLVDDAEDVEAGDAARVLVACRWASLK